MPQSDDVKGEVLSCEDTYWCKQRTRVRENQRRCRARRLAYVTTLEERVREYEQRAVKANIDLQARAQRLDHENRKMRNVLTQAYGLGDEEMDTDILVEKITASRPGRSDPVSRIKLPTPPAESLGLRDLTVALRSSEENGEIRSELQVISSREMEDVTVPCYVAYELLKTLLDERDPLAQEIRALELRNGGSL